MPLKGKDAHPRTGHTLLNRRGLAEDEHTSIVAARSDDAAELRVSPSGLPHCTIVTRAFARLHALSVLAQVKDLHCTIRRRCCDALSVKIKGSVVLGKGKGVRGEGEGLRRLPQTNSTARRAIPNENAVTRSKKTRTRAISGSTHDLLIVARVESAARSCHGHTTKARHELRRVKVLTRAKRAEPLLHLNNEQSVSGRLYHKVMRKFKTYLWPNLSYSELS